MDKRDTYSKAVCGPGGINCPCCSTGSKKFAKTLNVRGKRRRARMELRQSVELLRIA